MDRLAGGVGHNHVDDNELGVGFDGLDGGSRSMRGRGRFGSGRSGCGRRRGALGQGRCDGDGEEEGEARECSGHKVSAGDQVVALRDANAHFIGRFVRADGVAPPALLHERLALGWV